MNESQTIPSHVRFMADSDGAVILDLKKGKYYSLNGVGADIWAELTQGRRGNEILQSLRAKYSVPSDRLEDDLKQFMLGLQEKGLLDARE